MSDHEQETTAEPAGAVQPTSSEEPEPEPEAPAEAAAATAVEEPADERRPAIPEESWPDGEWPSTEEPAPEPAPDEPVYGHVVEEAEAGLHTVEHVGGEIDVPPGYALIEGEPRGEGRSVGVVVSRFNGGITNRMLESALGALAEAGVAQDAITVMPVPGAFELPLAAMALAKTRRYACVVALGCIIRGETPHFDLIASEAASGVQLAGIETGVPVSFGVLTCDTPEQAEARVGKAVDAVQSALEMADAFATLRASARS